LKITSGTAIYLDKSKLKQSNKKGSFADIKRGLPVKVKYKNDKPGGLIDWLKVQLE
jgi:hypothetical protein